MDAAETLRKMARKIDAGEIPEPHYVVVGMILADGSGYSTEDCVVEADTAVLRHSAATKLLRLL